MAYMSQETKKRLAPAIKQICKKHGINATLAVRHHCTLVLNIKSGAIDFNCDYQDVNPYWFKEHYADNDAALDFLSEVIDAMNDGNWNRSDSSVDYFDVGWYIDVNIGNWDKPYKLVEIA